MPSLNTNPSREGGSTGRVTNPVAGKPSKSNFWSSSLKDGGKILALPRTGLMVIEDGLKGARRTGIDSFSDGRKPESVNGSGRVVNTTWGTTQPGSWASVPWGAAAAVESKPTRRRGVIWRMKRMVTGWKVRVVIVSWSLEMQQIGKASINLSSSRDRNEKSLEHWTTGFEKKREETKKHNQLILNNNLPLERTIRSCRTGPIARRTTSPESIVAPSETWGLLMWLIWDHPISLRTLTLLLNETG